MDCTASHMNIFPFPMTSVHCHPFCSPLARCPVQRSCPVCRRNPAGIHSRAAHRSAWQTYSIQFLFLVAAVAVLFLFLFSSQLQLGTPGKEMFSLQTCAFSGTKKLKPSERHWYHTVCLIWGPSCGISAAYPAVTPKILS